ncbi:glycosyltransferase family 4 protein [Fulvivirgaceae bacterium BMA10]|uniref:Glycosyltransferase family 4 protein n=1 Tax=Splendidivirga corallicola TaxID=3051826 RepID=A0ABT8KY46_9BACT|nr:glycosyltransferase family 4 protein [Fulvivirgaceae bacterium BMA10]
MKILFLADPNSIHDIKWMTFFSKKFTCYLIARRGHLAKWTNSDQKEFATQNKIEILGDIEDFRTARFWKNFRNVRRLMEYIEIYQIDIFHIFFAEPNILWSNFKKRLNVPVFLTTRGTDVLKTIPKFKETGVFGKLVYTLYRRAFRKADCITCTSTKQISAVKKLLGGNFDKINLIRTGVDVDKWIQQPSLPLTTVLADKKYVLLPRSILPIYGHELAITAFAKLDDSLRSQYYLVLIDGKNSDKQYLQALETLIKTSPKIDYCILPACNQDEMHALYTNASLVVMTPKSDGTPVSAIEAILCNAPLILPPLDYDRDLFGDDVLKLKSRDDNELSDLMQKILKKEIELHTEEAKTQVMSRVSRNDEMTKLESLYTRFI